MPAVTKPMPIKGMRLLLELVDAELNVGGPLGPNEEGARTQEEQSLIKDAVWWIRDRLPENKKKAKRRHESQ
jgi:hypothetical protein